MEDQTVVTVSAGRKGGPLSRVKVYNKELFDTLAEESHKYVRSTSTSMHIWVYLGYRYITTGMSSV